MKKIHLYSLISLFIGLIFFGLIQPFRYVSLVLLISASMGFLISLHSYFSANQEIERNLNQLSQAIDRLISGELTSVIPITQDTMTSKIQSQLLKLTDILRVQKQKEENEKERLNTLISDISHQLKTPLSNLLLYESMSSHSQSLKEKDFSQKKQDQLNKLEWLIATLSNLSKLETGSIELNKKKTSLEPTLLKAIDQVTQKAEDKSIYISYELLTRDTLIPHDSKWTSEAIYNVLDNAVKYSEKEGQIKIIVSRLDVFMKIDIIDSGCGIALDDIHRIFKRFYRVQSLGQREGVGLGLYISQKIFRDQGGYITAESQLNKGTCISLFLPLNEFF